MPWQLTGLTVPLALSGLSGLVVAWLVWQERPKGGASWLSASAFAIGLWAIGEAIVVSHTGSAVSTSGLRLTLLAAYFVPALLFLFALEYTGRADSVGWSILGASLATPVAFAALMAIGHDAVSPFVAFGQGNGPALLFQSGGVLAVYAYVNGALLAAEYLLIEKFLASRNVFRKRTFLLLSFIAVLHVCHLATAFGVSPTPAYSLTPLVWLAFGVVSVLMIVSRSLSFLPLQRLLAPFGSHSKSLAPLARNQAIEEMETGFLVLDHRGRIVDTNPIGKRILGGESARVVGKEVSSVIPPGLFVDGTPAFVTDPTAVDGKFSGIWIERPDGERRCFDVMVSPLREGGETVGSVSLVHDVTDRELRKRTLEERTRELERQNDRLEEFAGIVSHDLRNPLNVAAGRLALVDAGDDQEHVETATDALDRMEELIEDVLTYARLGKTIDDVESVDVGQVARDAWANVDTGDAVLDVDLDLEIEASRSRLVQVFENLLRNAMEHGGSDVTVTVGALGDGFYVEDDGPGIPEELREQVLDQGYTTNDDGTGFGLSIVTTIVEAHGWDVAVDESEAGGARFEITGVQLSSRAPVTAD